MLKSPGIKPRRHNQVNSTPMSLPGTLPFSTKTLQLNNNNNNISNNLNNSNNNTSEGEQSPPGNNSSSSSAQDFSVFANVIIQGSHTTASIASDFSDTISLRAISTAPELPKRSNSIISLTNNSACTDSKPILSPRLTTDNVTSAYRSQPIVSPKLLESLNEERSPGYMVGATGTDNNNENAPPAISPRTDKSSASSSYHQAMTDTVSNRSPFQNSNQNARTNTTAACSRNHIYDDGASTSAADGHHAAVAHHHMHHHTHQPVYPPSPKFQNCYSSEMGDSGFPPISPHVNVPNAHAFNHHVPPPLPPRRREKKELDAVHLAQIRQAPDAPEVRNLNLIIYIDALCAYAYVR